METFSALLAICTGKSPVTGEFSAHRPGTRSFDIIFDLRLNKRLSKQSWSWSIETQSRPLWRHCNVVALYQAEPPTIYAEHKNNGIVFVLHLTDMISLGEYLSGKISRAAKINWFRICIVLMAKFEISWQHHISCGVYLVCFHFVFRCYF